MAAGAAYSGAFGAARREGLPVYRLRVLGKTSRIPYDPYCARSGLPPAAAQRVKDALLSLSTRSPDGQRILGRTAQINAWTEAHDRDYDSVRRALAASQQRSSAKDSPATDSPRPRATSSQPVNDE